MVVYSITDLENLCGIKAHTIRMWEKRYGILKAKRTESNIRYYTEEDLRLALNMCILYRKGLKISKLAKMSQLEIKNLVAETTEIDGAFEKSLDALSISMLELDEYKFVRILDKNIEQNGFDHTMQEVLYPLMDKISMMWIAGSIDEVHETFVLQIIKRKIIVEINQLPPQKENAKTRFLLYLPKEESQELSILYMDYLLRKKGFRVFNLGRDVNLSKLKGANELFKPDFVFTIINDAFEGHNLQEYLDTLCEDLDAHVLLSGYQASNQPLKDSSSYTILEDLSKVLEFTQNINK